MPLFRTVDVYNPRAEARRLTRRAGPEKKDRRLSNPLSEASTVSAFPFFSTLKGFVPSLATKGKGTLKGRRSRNINLGKQTSTDQSRRDLAFRGRPTSGADEFDRIPSSAKPRPASKSRSLPFGTRLLRPFPNEIR